MINFTKSTTLALSLAVLSAVVFLSYHFYPEASGSKSEATETRDLSSVVSSCDCGRVHPHQAGVEAPAHTAKAASKSAATTQAAHQKFQGWLKENQENNFKGLVTIEKGISLAKERKSELLELMRVDPEQALKLAVSWSEYKTLPAEIKPYIERPFSQRGDFLVYPICTGQEVMAGVSRQVYEVKLNEGSYRSVAYGRLEGIATKENTPLQGITLDDQVVVRSAPLQHLTHEDARAVRKDFPVANVDVRKDFATGAVIHGQPVIALGGGKLFYFDSAEQIAKVNKRLKKLDELPGPHSGAQVIFLQASADDGSAQELDWQQLESSAQLQADSWTETKKKVFFIRIDFSDNKGESTSQAVLENVLNTATSDSVRDMSYGKTWIEADVSSMVVEMPNPTSTYTPGNNSLLHSEAKAAFNALNTGINLGDYDIIGVHFKNIGMSGGSFVYAGLAGGSRQWLQGTTSSNVIIHEFGHNYGLGHARFWDTGGASVVGAGSTSEYGNDFDIMGNGPDPEGHFHPQAKKKVAWLGAADWVDTGVSGSGTHRLYRGDHKDTTGVRGLRVPKDAGINHYYWVGYRRAITSNNYLQSGVVLNWEKSGTSYLLDTTPGSSPGKADSGILIGQTYSDFAAGIHITPVAQGGSVPNEWIDVTVNIGSFPGNSAPTATLSGPATGDAREPLQFSVSASDSNGDALAYSWNFGDGASVSNQSSVSHTWDLGGTYNVEVTVTDMKGGTVSKNMSVVIDDPLNTWTVGNVGFTASMSEAGYINGRYILTGDQYAYFSLDGLNWTRSFLTNNFRAGGIAYGGGKYVITGWDWVNSDWKAVAFHSNDGKSWIKGNLPTMEYMNDVAYGNGRFVAVGNDGQNMYSLDGETWTAGNTVGTQDLDSVSYGNGEFVAVGDTQVHASSDGVTWVDRSNSTGLSSWHSFKDVHYAAGKFIAGGWYSGIRYSSDNGVTWDAAVMPAGQSYDVRAIHYAEGVFAATAVRKSDDTSVLLVSSDGVTWQEATPTNYVLAETLIYGNGVYFSTQGSSGATQYSNAFFPSNQTPTASISGDTSIDAREVVQFTSTSNDNDGDDLVHIWDFQDGTDLVTGSSTYHSFPTGGTYTVKLTVVDGNGGLATETMVVTVADPLNNWTQRTSGTTANLLDVAYGGGTLVAVGESSGSYRVSTDAVSWSGGTLGINIRLTGVIHDGSQFVASGFDYDFGISGWVGVTYTSPNGNSWTRRHFAGQELRDIAYGAGVYIACGDSGTIMRSTTGTSWSAVSSGVSSTLRGVSYGDGAFVVVGSGGVVLTSTDGLTWIDKSSSSGTSSTFYDVEYVNDRFLASGDSTKIRYSTDGGDSFSTKENENHRIPGFAYGNGVYLASGWDRSNLDADIDLVSVDGSNWSAMTTADREESNAAIFFQNTFITVGNNGEIRQSDVFSAPSGWSAWQASQFPGYPALSGAYEDFDGDGVANLMEYITGTNPKSQGSHVAPTLSEEAGYMTLTINKAAGISGYTMIVQVSDDLETWNTTGLTVLMDDASMLKVRLSKLTSDPTLTRKFLRAHAITSP